MPRKLHYLTSSGTDICGEYYSSSACGLGDDTDFEWDGTHKKEKATCKRCIAALAKPPEPRVPLSERARPILFAGPMVRAILDGKKTVTRRLMPAWQVPSKSKEAGEDPRYNWIAIAQNHPRWGFAAFGETERACADELAMYADTPYGRPWEKLWVRETFFAFGRWETRFSEKKGRDEWHFIDMTLETGRQYQYDSLEVQDFKPQRNSITPAWWLRPSIHMPRKASRILLEVTAVRVERLQDISEEQAIAEGGPVDHPNGTACGWFEQLWESLNGAGSWDDNPWVWVVEFKRVTP